MNKRMEAGENNHKEYFR